jgi:hypothetical protein
MNDPNYRFKRKKGKIMITKKFNFHLLINILLISSFSLIHGSESKKTGFFDGIRITNNKAAESTLTNSKPTVPVTITKEPVLTPTPVDGSNQASGNSKKGKVRENRDQEPQPALTEKQKEEAQKIDKYLAERKNQEFDVVEKEEPQAAQPILIETTAMPAISPDSLGMPYTRPSLPPQTSKTITTSRGLFALTAKLIEDYLDEIIQNGEFCAAHSMISGKKQYPKIGEDSGEALTANVTAFIAMLTNQNKEKTDLFQKHRQEFATFSNRLRRLALANQEPYAIGSINQQRTEDALQKLEQVQASLEESNDPLISQLYATEEALKNMREEVLALHPRAASQPQISTKRKLMIEGITQRSTTRK